MSNPSPGRTPLPRIVNYHSHTTPSRPPVLCQASGAHHLRGISLDRPGHNVAVPAGIIAVLLAYPRFYVRACLVRSHGKDDWLLLVAVIFCVFLLVGRCGELWWALGNISMICILQGFTALPEWYVNPSLTGVSSEVIFIY